MRYLIDDWVIWRDWRLFSVEWHCVAASLHTLYALTFSISFLSLNLSWQNFRSVAIRALWAFVMFLSDFLKRACFTAEMESLQPKPYGSHSFKPLIFSSWSQRLLTVPVIKIDRLTRITDFFFPTFRNNHLFPDQSKTVLKLTEIESGINRFFNFPLSEGHFLFSRFFICTVSKKCLWQGCAARMSKKKRHFEREKMTFPKWEIKKMVNRIT